MWRDVVRRKSRIRGGSSSQKGGVVVGVAVGVVVVGVGQVVVLWLMLWCSGVVGDVLL